MARTTIDELLADARRRLRRLSPAEALQGGTRWGSPDRYSRRFAGCPGWDRRGIAGDPRNVLEWRLDPSSEHRHPRAPQLDDHVILLCDEGYQSSLAAATLQRLGFARATDVEGGFQAWRAAGLPVEQP
jgi:rhodanese-related sulfurtransferase